MTEGAITQAMIDTCDRAAIADLRFHDLRHEATSRFFENTDLDAIEIASITGHKSMQMLKRYTHLRADRLARRLG
jgi:integrase